MKRFNHIIESVSSPSVQDLWLHKGILKYFGPKGWEPVRAAGDDLSNGTYLLDNVVVGININPTPTAEGIYEVTNPMEEIDNIVAVATASPLQYIFNVYFSGVVIAFTTVEHGGTGQITCKVVTDDGDYVLKLYDASNDKQSTLTHYPISNGISKITKSEIELYKRKLNATYNREADTFSVLLGTTSYNLTSADCAEMLIEFNRQLNISSDTSYLYYGSTAPYIKTYPIRNDIGALTLSSTFEACSQAKVVVFNTPNDIGVKSMTNTFKGCSALEIVVGFLDVENMSSFSSAFTGCSKLHTIKLKNLKSDLDLSPCPGISLGTLDYIVTNAIGTSAITITVEPTVLAKINSTDPAWVAVKEAATVKKITFA